MVAHELAKFEERDRKPTSLREAPGLPPELASEVTRSMDVIGDIAVLRLKDDLRPRASEIGSALMEVHPRLRAVAIDDGVHGELRVRALTVVAGEGPLVTTHREFGMELRVDLEHAYFSPRLATEHSRVADQVMQGERVLDMFAGVGPFAVLVARSGQPSEVHAVDLNEVAARLVEENARKNGVDELVKAHQGDAREVVPDLGVFDRIIMNHPHGAREFLDVALKASRSGTVIHLHMMGTPEESNEAAKEADQTATDLGHGGVRVDLKREVRTYSPGVLHWCLDLTVLEHAIGHQQKPPVSE